MCERWVESRRGLLGGLSEWWRPCGPSALRDQRETGPEPDNRQEFSVTFPAVMPHNNRPTPSEFSEASCLFVPQQSAI